MHARAKKSSLSVLLVEEHPFRNRLYREYIAASGCAVRSLEVSALMVSLEASVIVVLSIPEDVSTHSKYRALLDALPVSVSCIALSAGALPESFGQSPKLVRHFNRSETNPGELVRVLTFMAQQHV